MRIGTDLLGLSAPKYFRQAIKTGAPWLAMAGGFLGGILLARSTMFGGISPFGVAFVAGLNGRLAWGSAVGATIGYLLFGDMVSGIRYAAAVILVLALRWLIESLGTVRKYSDIVSAAISFLGLGITGGAFLFFEQPGSGYAIILTVSEAFLGCGAAYFFSRARSAGAAGLSAVSRADISCLVITFCIGLMALSSVFIGGLSLGRVAGVLFILLAAHTYREGGGAAAGICAGASIALTSGDFGYLVGAYALGALAAGLFSQLGKIPTAIAFIAVNTGFSLLNFEFAGANTAIYEAFAASVIFMAIPAGLVARLGAGMRGQATPGLDIQGSLRERLEDYGMALREIGQTTREVSRRLTKLEGPEQKMITRQVAGKVCDGCAMVGTCWQLRDSQTRQAIDDAVEILRKDGRLDKEKLSKNLLQGCCRLDELTDGIKAGFEAFSIQESTARKVGKVRAVLTEQFEGMADILSEAAERICSPQPFEAEKLARVHECFVRAGLLIQRLNCTLDGFGRMNIELVIPNNQLSKLSRTGLTLDLCAILEADFDLPELSTRETHSTLIFCEKANFALELGAYQLPSGKNRLCGDAYDFIRNKDGCTHLILSDGMGSGGAAAVDSAMACGLLVKLINVGVGHDAALKLVNSALLVKSGEESLATIDVCSFDLFSGKANFYKAGAAPTFILKSGKAGCLEGTSLPAGILHGVAFEKSSLTLHDGDTIVMVSDGVTSTGIDWVRSELGGLREADVQRLCEKLAITAKNRRTDGREDDVTVLAAAVRRID